MSRDPLIFEDIYTVPRRTLFKVAGVPFNATQNAWQGVLILIGAGIIIALSVLPSEAIIVRVIYGIIYGLLIELVYLLHNVGHVLGGKAIGFPMDENLITSTRQVNIYRGIQDYPREVHLARALGGPLFNILVGLIALSIHRSLGGHILLFFAVMNLIWGISSFLPLPSIDGEIIWRELRKGR